MESKDCWRGWEPDLVSERGGLQSRDFSDIVLTGSVRFSLSPWE